MKNKARARWYGAALAGMLLAGCGAAQEPQTTEVTDNVSDAAQTETAAETASEATAETATEGDTTAAGSETAEAEAAGVTTTDRSGNEIVVPAQVEKIISMAPSTTQLLIDLGYGDRIIAADTNSQYSYGGELGDDVVYFDMMAPDQEQIVALAPDIVFTSGMSSYDGTDAYASVRAAGLCVADIPSSASLAAIEEDIAFVGACIGAQAEADGIIADMEDAIATISSIAATIPEEERKTVLFELYTPSADYPTIYTAGAGTYINEMIETIGAINIAADEGTQWPALSEEAAVGADPQVILTADMYTPDVINTILTMEGWENVTAIQDGAVYQLDADSVNQPNQHVIDAMWDMAIDIYPEYYEDAQLQPAA